MDTMIIVHFTSMLVMWFIMMTLEFLMGGLSMSSSSKVRPFDETGTGSPLVGRPML